MGSSSDWIHTCNAVLIGILVQSPVGALIDHTRHKRWLILMASVVIAISCLVVIFFPNFYAIALSQSAVGLVQAVFHPCVTGITLGIVGHKLLSQRIGRNESLNHLGNMVGAIASGLIGWYISYEGIFYFSIFQAVAMIFAVLMIREKDIDHLVARSAVSESKDRPSITTIKSLFSDKDILFFTFAMALFHFANGAMLPLLGQKIGISDVEYSALYLSICIIIAQAVMVLVAPMASRFASNGRKNVMLMAFVLLPLRAFLFATIDNNYALISLQVLDGLGAGIFGVISILMMADLSKGTGHFNLLQGTVYAAMGLGISFSTIFSGFVVKNFGYSAGFITLGIAGILALMFFGLLIRESLGISKEKMDTVPV
ncbi:MAG TPA: MFS transporter [Bacteriovoracaceae bacterium]|nr:MFS transporter [Bacteriovoracaceae bacterium]